MIAVADEFPCCTYHSIGRVTKGLLLNIATNIDIIEPTTKFTDELAKQKITRNIFNVGLEAWHPTDGIAYDLIWIQWCASHLDDDQLAQFLLRSKSAIKEKGYIIFKENLSNTGVDIFDELDSSVTRYVQRAPCTGNWVAKCCPYREDVKFRTIFKRAGFKIIKTEVQRGMPDVLYPICTYALQPEP